MEEKTLIAFQCTEEMKREIRVKAAMQDQTISAFIRDAVGEALQRAPGPQAQSTQEQAQEA